VVGRYVVIEGLIGVGKSTLTRLLSEEWGARPVLEPNEQNPFLEAFYSDPERYAFPVQMFYLATRWKQQESIQQGDLFTDWIVSDYLFEKDRLFAEKTLNPMELELYDRFAKALTDRAPRPDLVVFLEAPIEVLMRRIDERKAPGESAIEPDYLVDLRKRYYQLFEAWTSCPLLILDNQDMDYRRDPVARRKVIDTIEAALRGETPSSSLGSDSDREEQQELF
jgi:deoxyguanosine kinase